MVGVEWDRHARWWQDGFTGGADAEYTDQIIPLAVDLLGGLGHVVDLGAGEGQIARAIRSTGTGVTALDVSSEQVSVGAARGGGVEFVAASVDAVPLRKGCADGVLACLVLEHVAGFESALAQAADLLVPDGRLVVMLNHPLLQTPSSGWIDDHILDPPEQYWRVGPYLRDAELVDEVEPDIHIRFFHRPLHRYVDALADAGLVVERILEPRPTERFLERASEYRDAALIPRLMVLIASPSSRATNRA